MPRQTATSQKSVWPAWFPYPSSWLRAFALALWIGVALRITLFWSSSFGIAFYGVTEHIKPLLWCLGLALLAAFFVFVGTHHFLFGKPSKRRPPWFPGRKSLWEGFYAPIVMSLAFAVSILCVLPFHTNYNYNSNLTSVEAGWFGSIWLIAASYLYQAEYLVRRWFALIKK